MPSVQLDRDYQVVLLTLEGEWRPSRLIKAYDTVFDFDTALALLNSGEKVFPKHWPYSPLTGRIHYVSRHMPSVYEYLGGYYSMEDLSRICNNFEFMLVSPRDLDCIVVTDDKEEVTDGA